MKVRKIFFILLLLSLRVAAQEKNVAANSFFENSELKEYNLSNIMVQGEVENPGIVDLTKLPLCGVPVKEYAWGKDKGKFIGAYYFQGYSLYDIINSKIVKKAEGSDFKPAVDLYLVIENEKGEKTVVSWGEIYYSRDNFKILISKTVRGINPSKMKMKWPLSENPRLICANDAFNCRFISNPTKITVKSFKGTFPAGNKEDMYSASMKFITDNGTANIKEIDAPVRTYDNYGYGHGMGNKGIDKVSGYLFKDVCKAIASDGNDIRNTIVCVSAKDSYRAVYSLSEIINRGDNIDFLVVDKKDDKTEGRFNLYASPDFFVDRNVRSVEKVTYYQEK